ncbi:MAG: hypothetical protein GY765_27560, partial [bacterium]|nr:hypothetical protein [bacterium]
MSVKPVSLKCSGCGGNLDGANNSKVFFCTACHLACNVEGDTLSKFALNYAEPKIDKNYERLYFPFWHFESEVTVLDKGSDQTTRDSGLFYVPAFFIKNINYFGDIGYYYLLKQVRPQPGSRLDLP